MKKILHDLTVSFLSIMCRMLTRKTFMLPAIIDFLQRLVRVGYLSIGSAVWGKQTRSLLMSTHFGGLVCFDYKCRLWSTWIGTASGSWCYAESLLTLSSFSVKPKKKLGALWSRKIYFSLCGSWLKFEKAKSEKALRQKQFLFDAESIVIKQLWCKQPYWC